MLRSESWTSCTGLIDPEAYIQACTQDMCGCTNTTSDFCICSTLSEFSRQCSHAGGQPPNWRTSQFCGKVFTLNQLCVEAHDCIWEKSCMNEKMSNIKTPHQNSLMYWLILSVPPPAKQCPYNMVYEESGSPCMDTCTHMDTSSVCEDHKMDGCFCPPGSCHPPKHIVYKVMFIAVIIKLIYGSS